MRSLGLTYHGTNVAPTAGRDLFITECIVAVAHGLSLFMRRPVKVALLFAPSDRDPLAVYDPYALLKTHKNYISANFANYDSQNRGQIRYPHEPGLWQEGFFNTEGTDFQRWFVEEGLATARDINKRWLEEAARVIMHELPYRDGISTEIFFSGLRKFAPDAIANHIDAAMQEKFQKESTSNIVHRVADLSVAVEEGKLPAGKIVFVRHSRTWIDPATRLVSGIDLANIKLLRKLLTGVQSGSHYLVANERQVMGFSNVPIPDDAVVANFQGHRTLLTVRGNVVAELRNGTYYAGLPALDLSIIKNEIEELCGANATNVLASLKAILSRTYSARSGCSIVIADMNLTGQKVQPAIDLSLSESAELVSDLASIDGAIHLKKDGCMHAFGCLLDGSSASQLEDPARGARYNSAVRFTHANPNSLVITASEDGPITAFVAGRAITPNGTGLPPELPGTIFAPQNLSDWLGIE